MKLAFREDTHHAGHFIGTVLTCGLWAPVWLLFIFLRMGMRPPRVPYRDSWWAYLERVIANLFRGRWF